MVKINKISWIGHTSLETVLQRRCGHCVHLKLAILVSSRCYPYYLYCRCHKHYLLAKVPTSTTPTLAASKKKIYTLTMGLSMMYSSGIKFLPFCLAETARGLSTQSWRLKGDEDDENDHQQHHQPPTTPTSNHHQIEKGKKKNHFSPTSPTYLDSVKKSFWLNFLPSTLSALRAISGSKPPSWCAWWHRSFHRPPWWIWSSHHLWCLHDEEGGWIISGFHQKERGEYLSSKEKCMIHIVVELFWPYEFCWRVTDSLGGVSCLITSYSFSYVAYV